METKDPEIKQLYRELYMAAKSRCHNPDDKELIRLERQSAVEAVTERMRGADCKESDYKLCTVQELAWACRVLKQGTTALQYIPQAAIARVTYASKKEQMKLHFLLLKIGVLECPVDGHVIGGLEGRELRSELSKRLALGQLDGAWSQHVYRTWGVPLLRRWLVEGGFKPEAFRGEKFLNWAQLTQKEAAYIIVRLTKMDNQLTERRPAFPPSASLN